MSNAIWRYDDGIWKAHCSDSAVAKTIAKWEGCEASSIYYYPDGHTEMDVLFPKKLYNRVAELLGLPSLEKNPKRVAQGQRMSVVNKKHRFLRNTNIKNSPDEKLSSEVKGLVG